MAKIQIVYTGWEGDHAVPASESAVHFVRYVSVNRRIVWPTKLVMELPLRSPGRGGGGAFLTIDLYGLDQKELDHLGLDDLVLRGEEDEDPDVIRLSVNDIEFIEQPPK